MGNIENETERDTVAMTLFGKSADSLAGILDDGGAALKELGTEAEQRGVIISQEDLDKANELNDILDRLKATFAGSLGQAAAKVAEAMTPLLEDIATVLTKVADVIANMSPQTLEIIAVVLAAVAAIAPIAGIISTIATTISTIIPIIAAVNAVIAANPVVLIILGIIAAIALLVAAGKAIYDNWDTIKAAAGELWENIKARFEQIKEAIVGAFNAVKEAITFVFETITGTIREKLDNIKAKFEENGGGIKGIIAAIWEAIKSYFRLGFDIINKLTGGKLKEIVDIFVNKFKEVIDKAKTWGHDLIENFTQGIKDKIQKVKDTVANVAQTVKDFLGFSEPDKGPLSNFHTFMPDMIDLMTKGINENMYKVTDSMNQLATRLVPETSVNVNYNDSAIASRLDGIGSAIANPVPVIAQVNLMGDAKRILKVVGNQNNVNTRATGTNILA